MIFSSVSAFLTSLAALKSADLIGVSITRISAAMLFFHFLITLLLLGGFRIVIKEMYIVISKKFRVEFFIFGFVTAHP